MEACELLTGEETVIAADAHGNGVCHEVGINAKYNSAKPDMVPNKGAETSPRVTKAYLITKRCFDVVFSLSAGVVALIPMLILALLIVLKDFGNPFYVHKRVGQNGKVLWVAKLRSMKLGSDDLEHTLTAEQMEVYRREYKLDDDPRLIGWKKAGDGSRCFGSLIRRTSLDEIPQIVWNILIKGNMSLVGPRPILRDELEQYYTSAEQKLLLSVKPGLTGYWQAYARNNATYETGERQRMELYYVQNQNIWLDIKIMFATISAVLRKNGAR